MGSDPEREKACETETIAANNDQADLYGSLGLGSG